MRLRWQLVHSLTALVVLSGISSAARAFDEPDGFEKAKFGMSEAQFTKVYPHAVSTRPTPGPNDPPPPFEMNNFVIEKLNVGPLKDCRASFRFYQSELYDIQFVCPDKAAITKYLQSRFGMPNNTTANALMWAGKQRGVSLVPKVGVFSFHDLAHARAAQAAVLRALQSAAVTPTPVAVQ